MKYLADPRLFNFAMLALCGLASIRWAFARDYSQAGYWLAAFWLNVFVLMMAGRS